MKEQSWEWNEIKDKWKVWCNYGFGKFLFSHFHSLPSHDRDKGKIHDNDNNLASHILPL